MSEGRLLPSTRFLTTVVYPLIAVGIALLISGLMIAGAGINPFHAFQTLFTGAFGSLYHTSISLTKVAPVLLAGLALALAYHCGLFNIGAEGQIYVGGLLAAYVGIHFAGLPKLVHIPFALAAGFAGGALWGLIPGVLRAKRDVSEVISTLMLNYVGFYLVSYFVNGPMFDVGATFPRSELVQSSAELPFLIPKTRLHLGVVIAFLVPVLVYLLVWKTTFGFQLRAVGRNPHAARYAGMSVTNSIIAVMALSGGLAGLAGGIEVLGVHRRLIEGFSPGYGYDGIAVAFLGGLKPFGISLAAIFFGVLRSGAATMQRMAGVPVTVVILVQGLAVLFVMASFNIQHFPREFWKDLARSFSPRRVASSKEPRPWK